MLVVKILFQDQKNACLRYSLVNISLFVSPPYIQLVIYYVD